MSQLHRKAEEFRQRLLEREGEAASDLSRAHAAAWAEIEAHLERLAEERDAALGRGETVDAAWLLKQRRLAKVLSAAKQAFGAFAGEAAQRIRAEQVAAAKAGRQEARELVEAAHAEAGRAADFTKWQPASTRELVGRSGDGQPLRERLDRLGPAVREAMEHHLKQAIATQKDLRAAVPHVHEAMGRALTRTLTTSCTETLRVYRESARRAYAANPEQVQEWRWTATKQARTCAACLAMDGQEFPVRETLEGHPNCRCMMVPVVEGLGPAETGEAWLRGQPEAVQREVLGQAGQRAWAAGEVELRDFVGRRESAAWGSMRVRVGLEEARRNAEERKKAEAGGKVVGATAGSARAILVGGGHQSVPRPPEELKGDLFAIGHWLDGQPNSVQRVLLGPAYLGYWQFAFDLIDLVPPGEELPWRALADPEVEKAARARSGMPTVDYTALLEEDKTRARRLPRAMVRRAIRGWRQSMGSQRGITIYVLPQLGETEFGYVKQTQPRIIRLPNALDAWKRQQVEYQQFYAAVRKVGYVDDDTYRNLMEALPSEEWQRIEDNLKHERGHLDTFLGYGKYLVGVNDEPPDFEWDVELPPMLYQRMVVAKTVTNSRARITAYDVGEIVADDVRRYHSGKFSRVGLTTCLADVRDLEAAWQRATEVVEWLRKKRPGTKP